ncbi:hypothetical protein GW17_00037412 [Ensete ventricosum]|nr:hypothetical protein GW17_00037412 [Ensete ventricosum]
MYGGLRASPFMSTLSSLRSKEFSRPVKASHVLRKDLARFVRNAYDMEFDDFISPIHAEDGLRPGLLYFLLSVFMLRRPLHVKEIS